MTRPLFYWISAMVLFTCWFWNWSTDETPPPQTPDARWLYWQGHLTGILIMACEIFIHIED